MVVPTIHGRVEVVDAAVGETHDGAVSDPLDGVTRLGRKNGSVRKGEGGHGRQATEDSWIFPSAKHEQWIY